MSPLGRCGTGGAIVLSMNGSGFKARPQYYPNLLIKGHKIVNFCFPYSGHGVLVKNVPCLGEHEYLKFSLSFGTIRTIFGFSPNSCYPLTLFAAPGYDLAVAAFAACLIFL